MSGRFSAVVGVIGLAVATGGLAARGQAPGGPSIDEIKKAWATRQGKVKSARVEWTSKKTIPKGLMDPIVRAEGGKGTHPPRDIIVEGEGELQFDERRYQFSLKSPVWSVKHLEVKPFEHVFAFDGDRHVSFIRVSPDSGPPTAHLHPSDHKTTELAIVSIAPILMTFRGTDPKFFQPELDLFEVTGRVVTVNARSCTELVRVKRASAQREYLLLDRERDYVVVRKYIARENVVLLRMDVTYAQDPMVGWVPQSWEHAMQTGNKAIVESMACRVTKCEISPAQTASDFRPVFPPGTRVIDATTGTSMEYVVKPDGGEGERIPTSQRPTYAQLTEAEPTRLTWEWRTVVVWAAGVVFLLSAAGLVWIRYARRARRALASGNSPAT
jgi:hypothetical protein